MESQQIEPLSQQPQPGAAVGQLGAAPGSAVPGDTPWNARGSLHSCLQLFCTLLLASACFLAMAIGILGRTRVNIGFLIVLCHNCCEQA